MKRKKNRFIVCSSSGNFGVKGSVPSNCCKCDVVVWISPASTPVIMDDDLKPICLKCAIERSKGNMGLIMPNEEQMDEIMSTFKGDPNAPTREEFIKTIKAKAKDMGITLHEPEKA